MNKKKIGIIIAIFMATTQLAGLTVPALANGIGTKEIETRENTGEVVTIPDENLKAGLKTALGVTDDNDITKEKLAGLTRLNLDSKNITNLQGLEYCVGITILTLTNNNLSDISPLSGLRKLEFLYLSRTGVSNVEPLGGLTNLKILVLNETGVIDISHLSTLINLIGLNLNKTGVSDISVLGGLTNLSSLHLSETAVSDISPLSSLINLHTLNISKTKVIDIGTLKDLLNLSNVEMPSPTITNPEMKTTTGEVTIDNKIVGFNKANMTITLSNGGTYDATNNKITWTGITADTNLTYEFSEEITIKDKTYKFSGTVTQPVKKKATYGEVVTIPDPNLKATLKTALGVTNDTDITDENLAGLTTLNLSNRDITDLQGLEYCTGITLLNLTNNKVSDISHLSGLTNLSWLNLNKTGVSDISPLSSLRNLNTLDISETKVTDISPLNNLANLTSLLLPSPTITNPEMETTTGEVTIYNKIVGFNKANMTITLSNGGTYDATNNKITWTGITADTNLTYGFSEKITINSNEWIFSGTVTQPVKKKATSGGGGSIVPITYTITAKVEGKGTITALGNTDIIAGESKTYIIKSEEGYEISDVKVDGKSIGAVDTFTFKDVSANHTIEVIFKEKEKTQYTITAKVGENGIINLDGPMEVKEGENSVLTITPNKGYFIDKVIINGIENQEAKAFGTYTFENMRSNITIEITFIEMGKVNHDKIYKETYDSTMKALALKNQKSINEARCNIDMLKKLLPNHIGITTFSALLDKVQHPIYIEIVDGIMELKNKVKNNIKITPEEVKALRVLCEGSSIDGTDNIPLEYYSSGWSEELDKLQNIANK